MSNNTERRLVRMPTDDEIMAESDRATSVEADDQETAVTNHIQRRVNMSRITTPGIPAYPLGVYWLITSYNEARKQKGENIKTYNTAKSFLKLKVKNLCTDIQTQMDMFPTRLFVSNFFLDKVNEIAGYQLDGAFEFERELLLNATKSIRDHGNLGELERNFTMSMDETMDGVNKILVVLQGRPDVSDLVNNRYVMRAMEEHFWVMTVIGLVITVLVTYFYYRKLKFLYKVDNIAINTRSFIRRTLQMQVHNLRETVSNEPNFEEIAPIQNEPIRQMEAPPAQRTTTPQRTPPRRAQTPTRRYDDEVDTSFSRSSRVRRRN